MEAAIPVCQSPDLEPRAPGFTIPRGACDCHAHVFGPPDRYPYKVVRRYTPDPAGLDEYRAMLRALGIARAVVVQPGIYRDNRATLDALASAGGLWRGVAR
ncbi:MAG: amidohydrolase family protein, partial [Acidisphaera sp.]|nr:amidohydrolase family protein [Acidisphaera sp.]